MKRDFSASFSSKMNLTKALGAFSAMLVVADAANTRVRTLASSDNFKPRTLEVLDLSLQAATSESNNGSIKEVEIFAIFKDKTAVEAHEDIPLDRLLSPVEYTTCPASRAQCTFAHDDLTADELVIYNKLGTSTEWENLFESAQTAQLVFDWTKVTLKGTGPNSCVPAPVAIANFAFVGAPFDVLNPLFYVEILVAGPCETFKPRIETMYERLNNLYKAAKLLAKIPKIGTVFNAVAKFFKTPVDALKELLDAMKTGCKAVSNTRQTARKTIEILNHVGTASGIIGSLMDYYLISICNQANENAGNARVRAAAFPNTRLRGLQAANEVDAELQKQAEIIRTRTEVPKAVYDFVEDFDERVAPVLNELKATWDKVEEELEDIFGGIENVMEFFAPFQDIIDILGQIDCSEIPVVSYACEALDLVNELLEVILDAVGIGDLLDSLEDAVRDAIDLPIDFSFDTPFDGLINLDLDGLLPDFDALLLDLRTNLMANLPNPIDDIHDAVESAVSKLNSEQPAKYDIKTMLTHTAEATWSCPGKPGEFMPVVASATYYGPDCVDTLDGVWRIPCDGISSGCTKNYLTPDSRLTCATQSLSSYTSPEPQPALTLAPPQHTFSSVYLCVPPTELESLGIMPILNEKNGAANFPASLSEVGPFTYSNKNICTNLGGRFAGTVDQFSFGPIPQYSIDTSRLVTTDQLVCSGDARSVLLEYRSHEPTQEQLACLDVTGPLYATNAYTAGYGMKFLCFEMFLDLNLGPDGGIFPNDVGPAFCMYPNNKANACTAQGIYPFTTNDQCNLPTTAAEGAADAATMTLNTNRENVWNHLQNTKALYTKDEQTCFDEYAANCRGKTSCTKPSYCPAFIVQFACVFMDDALDNDVSFTFGESKNGVGRRLGYQCFPNQEVVVKSASRGRGLGGSRDLTETYRGRLACTTTNRRQRCEITQFYSELGPETLRLEFGCECVAGYVQEPNEFGDCVACAPGTKRANSDGVCRKCLPGTFQDSIAADSCIDCPAGTYAIGSGSDRCTPCPAGTASLTIGATTDSTCNVCPPGYSAGPGASTCTPCDLGESTNGLGRAPKCDECVRGSYAAGTGNADCTPCPLGTFAMEERASQCNDCLAGTYAADLGSTYCTSCPPGSYASSRKSTECTCCPDGEFIYDEFLRATTLGAATDLCQEIIIDPVLASIDPFSDTDTCFASPLELGNGLCSPYANTLACNWDGGDCCYETCIYDVETSGASCYFSTLQCLDPDPVSHAVDISLRRPSEFEPAVIDENNPPLSPQTGCAQDPRVGDGLCNDDLNFFECDYDGGDCCPSTCLANTPGCKFNKCKRMDCKNPEQSTPPDPPKFVPLVPGSVALQCSELVRDAAVAAVAPPTLIAGVVKRFNSQVIVIDSVTDGSCVNDYVIKRTIQSEQDAFGQQAVLVQTITVSDDTKPSLTVNFSGISGTVESRDVRVYAPDDGSTSDNCQSGASIEFTETRDSSVCANSYVLKRKWVASDACDNENILIEDIVVVDATDPLYTAPIISDPEDLMIWPLGDVREFSLQGTFGYDSARDDCGNDDGTYCSSHVTINWMGCTYDDFVVADAVDCSYDPQTDTILTRGTRGDVPVDSDYSRIYEFKVQVIDSCDNFIETAHQITVRPPPPPPVFNPPPAEFAPNITIECSDPRPQTSVLAVWDFVLYGVPVVYDQNVAIDDSDVTPGRCISNSVVVEVFTSSTDLFGRFAQTSRTITIQDTTAPALSFSSDPVDAMVAPEAVPDPVQASATDNCLPSAPAVDYIEEREELAGEQACVNSYILNRKWSTKDVCDNAASVEQVLTVIDDVPPAYTPKDVMYVWPPNKSIHTFSLMVDFGYGQVTNGCGSADPKYCVDDVTVEFVSCTDNQLGSYRKALPSDCTYDPVSDTLRVLADRDGSTKTPRDYTIMVRLVDACGNALETINTVRVSHDQS